MGVSVFCIVLNSNLLKKYKLGHIVFVNEFLIL